VKNCTLPQLNNEESGGSGGAVDRQIVVQINFNTERGEARPQKKLRTVYRVSRKIGKSKRTVGGPRHSCLSNVQNKESHPKKVDQTQKTSKKNQKTSQTQDIHGFVRHQPKDARKKKKNGAKFSISVYTGKNKKTVPRKVASQNKADDKTRRTEANPIPTQQKRVGKRNRKVKNRQATAVLTTSTKASSGGEKNGQVRSTIASKTARQKPKAP